MGSGGFEVRDGTRPPAETAEWLLNHVRSELEKPHVHYVHSNNVDVGGADKVLVRMAQHMGPHHPSGPGDFRVSVSLRLPTDAVSLHEKAGTPVLLREFERPQVSAGIRGLARFAVQGPRTYLYFSRLFKKSTGVSPTYFREFETAVRGGSNLSMPLARPSIP